MSEPDEISCCAKHYILFAKGSCDICTLRERLAEVTEERDAAQKRFEDASQLSAERGCEISELKEKLAALREERDVYRSAVQEGIKRMSEDDHA